MRLFKKEKKKNHMDTILQKDEFLLTEDSPFSIREAYKTIRTNLMFSIPDEKCRKILITSSKQHEGKSITAINLGITFAENHLKVLLIDCDLRLPTDAKKLQLKQTPGLTNLLVGMAKKEEVIHHLSNGLDVIAAGDIPPNPSELLGSRQMSDLIQALEKEYEYIIFDTPPVCTVTDAAILAKQMSGVVIVARRNTSEQESISSALNLLEFSGAKLLGFIFTGALNEQKKSYKKYGYGYGYGYSYSDHHKSGHSHAASEQKE